MLNILLWNIGQFFLRILQVLEIKFDTLPYDTLIADPAAIVNEAEKENGDESQSTEEPNASTKLMQNDDATKNTSAETDKDALDEEKGLAK